MSSQIPLLDVEHLGVRFGTSTVVDDVSFSIAPAEKFALVGESGSGKSITALSVLRLVDAAVTSGAIRFEGADLLKKTEREMRGIRGAEIAMIFQEPMTALNPLYTVGNQIGEVLELHEGLRKNQARARAIELLTRTGIPEPERRVDAYPHQLSGGQRQRAMIAMALACKPKLLICDEPTTALDVTIQAQILALLDELHAEMHMALLFITHDLNLVRRFTHRVGVMERGKLVEIGETGTVFGNPQHAYTKKLLASRPQRVVAPLAHDAPTLVEGRGVGVTFTSSAGWFSKRHFLAVRSATLALKRGETLGIVGESGSGKTTLLKSISARLTPQKGDILYEGRSLYGMSEAERRRLLRTEWGVVHQHPMDGLRRQVSAGGNIGERLMATGARHYGNIRATAQQWLSDVEIPTSRIDDLPTTFSGGMQQRLQIARNLVTHPKLVFMDEPTGGLDVSVQARLLDLLRGLVVELDLAVVIVTHDLGVARLLADRLMVMKEGRVVESGLTDRVLDDPLHPYTQLLVSSVLQN
jgi:microcin C transport system ATP-binding protein